MLKTTLILFDVRDTISIVYRWFQEHDPTYEHIYKDSKRITTLIARQIYVDDNVARNKIIYYLAEFIYEYSAEMSDTQINSSINRLISRVQDSIIETVTDYFPSIKSRDVVDIIAHKGSYIGVVVMSPHKK